MPSTSAVRYFIVAIAALLLDAASPHGAVLVARSGERRTQAWPLRRGPRGITRKRQSEPLQHRLQGGSLHAEAGGRSSRASDHPARLFENPRDVCTLDAFERLGSIVDGSGA